MQQSYIVKFLPTFFCVPLFPFYLCLEVVIFYRTSSSRVIR